MPLFISILLFILYLPAGINTVTGLDANASINANVSSVIPSPTAPKLNTLTTPRPVGVLLFCTTPRFSESITL